MIDYFLNHQDRVIGLFVQHLQLSGVALTVSLLLALPTGVLVSRYRPLTGPVLGVLGAVYTIPSLALLALLVPYLGIGRAPALVALIAYAQLVLVRNVVVGLRAVEPAVVEAATGMGMTPLQVFWKVEMPLALPVMLAGVRIATVVIIGIGTVAAYVDAGGLGTLLFDGVSQNDAAQIETGAVAIGALAVAADLGLRLVEWRAARATGVGSRGGPGGR